MKTYLILFATFYLFNLVQGQSEKKMTYNLLIGTFTSSANSDGIWVYDFNPQTGDYILKSTASGVENPSYLAISNDSKNVYAVNEVKNGGVSALSFNPVSGELKFLNRVSSGGNGPCYVAVDDKKKFVFAGNYGSGSLCAIPVKDDGSLGNEIQFIQQEGGSIDKNRQQGPHVHMTLLSPDNHFLLTANLGTDKINTYKFEPGKNAEPLTPAEPAFVQVKPGSGPRHMVFSSDSKFLFLLNEMSGMITTFDYNDGKLVEKQSVTLLSADYKGRIGAADIHISPDGKFLYASNRGDANELVIFSISKNGTLIYSGRQSTLGRTPRNFAIDPTGNFLLAANQDTNEIIIFKRDQKTGMLSPTGKKIQVNKPVCLKFITN